LSQFEGVLGGESGLVIVEIEKNAVEIFPPVSDSFRPKPEVASPVVSLICAAGTVQPDIGEIRSDLDGRLKAG
jgi:hypothetical protein